MSDLIGNPEDRFSSGSIIDEYDNDGRQACHFGNMADIQLAFACTQNMVGQSFTF